MSGCENCYADIPDDKTAFAVTVPRVQGKKPQKWLVCSRRCARELVKDTKNDIRSQMQILLDQVRIVKVGNAL